MDIPELLAQNTTAHLNDPIPTHADLLEVEEQLTQSLPIQYKQFVLLGGLNDLRFKHDILSPSEILKNRPFVAGSKLIPFGSNGCGDLFCWKAGEQDDPPVYFWDHEEARCSLVSERCSERLVDQRF